MALLLDGESSALRFDLEGTLRSAPVAAPAAPASRRTLDDLVSETWEGLLAAAPASCPVCDGDMAPRWSAGAGVVGGRCENCGSELG
ncbi:MAG TPA: hypothetical protein VN213_09885 [Solirubrobacteraceae bacterium]|nr:hypothetical protein [Solirubrobacteraceae bacterium]